MGMKRLQTVGKSLLLAAYLSTPALADDTDIYLESNRLSVGTPRVMLTIDFRANVGGNQCTDAASAACETLMGSEVYPVLDLVDAAGNDGADGVADIQQVSGATGAERLALLKAGYWSGKKVGLYDMLRAVLYVVLNEVEGVRVGLMINHEATCRGDGPNQIPTGGQSGCSQGAYVLKGFFDPADAAELNDLFLRLGAIPEPDVKEDWMSNAWNGHGYALRDLYFEFYRYLTGRDMHYGWLGYDDYNSLLPTENLHQSTNDVVFDGLTLLSPDTSIIKDYPTLGEPSVGKAQNFEYISPMDETDSCSAIYMINSLFGSTANSSSDSAFAESVGSGGLNLTLRGGQDAKDTEIVKTFRTTDFGTRTYMPHLEQDIDGSQSVISYFVTDKVRKNTNDMAAAGGTGTAIQLTDPGSTLQSLRDIFTEILSVSTTFVAASVPVNVFNRAQIVDNVYLAIFQAEKQPLWNGNVKKLRIANESAVDPETGELVETSLIVDANGNLAFARDDGRISFSALTYWTDPNGADVSPADPSELVDPEEPGRDGRSVDRGGAGQQIPGFLDDMPSLANATGGRKLFTENPVSGSCEAPASGCTAMPYNADSATASTLAPYLDPTSSLSSSELQALIGWGRGVDVLDSDGDGSTTDARPWLMGDPMHSRPLVVNYGDPGGSGDGYSETNPLIMLFFGTNDGWFHALRNTEGNGSEAGDEVFAFMPLEVMDKQQALARNMALAGERHPYGVDGEAVVFTRDLNRDGNLDHTAGDKAYVYTGLRRGGKAYYAFDFSDPDNPQYLWKITDQTAGFDQLALSFATPRTATLNLDGTLTDVVIFTGGYNGGWMEDPDNPGLYIRVGKDGSADPDYRGNAIYIVNADTGALVWKAVGPNHPSIPSNTAASATSFYAADMIHSFPASVTVVDSDGNDVHDRLYVGDAGGQVWRVDLTEGVSPLGAGDGVSNWFATRIADFGVDVDRRFHHAPDVTFTYDSNGSYAGIMLTSGDRANPKSETTADWAYYLKDRNLVTGSTAAQSATPLLQADLADVTDLCTDDTSGDIVPCSGSSLANGWKLALEEPGEKGLSTPLISSGVVLFTTYLPRGGTPGACAPSEGSGRVYVVNLRDGTPYFDLKSDLASLEADRYEDIGPGIPPGVKPLADQVLVPGKGIGGNQIVPLGGRNVWKVYWRETDVDRL
jgi:type IV pilus assembly protein PilY1